jgi:hypothetical protein
MSIRGTAPTEALAKVGRKKSESENESESDHSRDFFLSPALTLTQRNILKFTLCLADVARGRSFECVAILEYLFEITEIK